MKIKLNEITIRELCGYDANPDLPDGPAVGYKDLGDEGITGYNGRLNIRPAYQREFVYKDAQRNKVIETVMQGYPLNVMYWVNNKAAADGSEAPEFELLDGQQRTISICSFVAGSFSVNGHYFNGLPLDVQQKILDYKLMIYFCEGTDSQKLEWFKTINIAGVKLTDQELRNAIYTGPWLTAAKKYFSKPGCPAYIVASKFLDGSLIQQDYLATALKWISKDHITDYMAEHQADTSANELWLYFKAVIDWVQATFPDYRHEMKGLNWGELYDTYNKAALDPTKLTDEVDRLMVDDEIETKKGIYAYVLTRKEKYLSLRAFKPNVIRETYDHQDGVCPICKEKFDIGVMEGDHIIPWSKGGKTVPTNCQMLCKPCNASKGAS